MMCGCTKSYHYRYLTLAGGQSHDGTKPSIFGFSSVHTPVYILYCFNSHDYVLLFYLIFIPTT